MPVDDHGAMRREAALVLVGHGSSRNPASSAPTRACGAEIARRGLFSQVQVAFWKEEPFLGRVLEDIAEPEVYVVPNLAAKGYITGQLIPKEMGLDGPVTLKREGRQRVYLCDPVGTHPRIAACLADRAWAVIDANRLAPAETCILLIGHGTSRNRQSAIQTRALAGALARRRIALDVQTAFLEQAPLVEDWWRHTEAKSVIVMPFMISNGVHGAEDIPELLGIDPRDSGLKRMMDDGTAAGPYAVRDRRLWYCRAVGSEPLIADLVLDQVAAFDHDMPA